MAQEKNPGDVLCELHGTHAVEFYCPEHDVILCRFCKPINHKECFVKDVNSLCEEKLLNQNIGTTLSKLTTLEEKTKIALDAIKTTRATVVTDIAIKRKSLRELRKDFNELFNSYESSLSIYEKTGLEQIAAEEETYRCIIQQVKLAHNNLESVQHKTTGTFLFHASLKTVQMSKSLANVVDKVGNDSKQEFIFDEKDHVSKIIEDFLTLFNQEENKRDSLSEKTTNLEPDYQSFWNINHCSLTKEVDAKLKSDKYSPCITGCCFTRNNQLVLCDNANSKVKFLDTNINHKYELPFIGKPFDVVSVNNDKIIVSVPDRKLLQYVAITPGIKMGSGLRVGDSCYSLDLANDKIYACFENMQYTYNYMTNVQTISKRDCGVRIYTVDGKVLKSITMMPIGEGRPLYLALNSDGSKIFYSGESDADTFVICTTDTEHGLYKYAGKMLSKPRALVSDDDDNVLVCDGSSNVVLVVNSDGIRSKCLLTETDKLDSPISVCYNKESRTLVVASNNSAGGVCLLKVFSIIYK